MEIIVCDQIAEAVEEEYARLGRTPTFEEILNYSDEVHDALTTTPALWEMFWADQADMGCSSPGCFQRVVAGLYCESCNMDEG